MTISFTHMLRTRVAVFGLVAFLTALAFPATTAGMPQRNLAGRPDAKKPSLAPNRASSSGRSLFGPVSRPYLAVLSAIPLRFAPPPKFPLSAPHGPPAPPEPVKPIEAPEPVIATPPTPPPAEPEPAPAETTISAGESPPQPRESGVSILPDDTRRDIRAEDVLPFFQFPAGNDASNAGTVVVPFTPAAPTGPTMPPSSATYKQQ